MTHSDEVKIMLLGKGGDGKSNTGNTIFREKIFTVVSSASSTSAACEVGTKIVNGKTLTVIDTPGLFGSNLPDDRLKQVIQNRITESSSGIHAFIIVLRVGTYTDQEANIIEKVMEMFGKDILQFTVVLFTHGDQLDDDQTIEDFVEKNSVLKELVKKCGGRCHVLDNKYWNQKKEGYRSNRVQVERLLNTIDRMVRENGGACYIKDMLPTEEERQEEKENFRNRLGPLLRRTVLPVLKGLWDILQWILRLLSGIWRP
ncbi:GTPase IMAP family member 4-like [Chanos chanos]|uniref:GTPase IMAP family member 4-like n=1 Tax=Chanos chanos TaxID=29144 RepID=A0A6J2VQJ9_CHACN|nr:GTPase IMAP family member 4-like [Chanos chanos]